MPRDARIECGKSLINPFYFIANGDSLCSFKEEHISRYLSWTCIALSIIFTHVSITASLSLFPPVVMLLCTAYIIRFHYDVMKKLVVPRLEEMNIVRTALNTFASGLSASTRRS